MESNGYLLRLALLFGLHLIGGMGAGDVVTGGYRSLCAYPTYMVHLYCDYFGGSHYCLDSDCDERSWTMHYFQAREILREIFTVRNADKLYEILR